MAAQADPEDFIYYVPLPTSIRNIELAFASFVAGVFLLIPYRLGFNHTLQAIQNDPLIWLLLIAIFAPGIALFVLFAFPPKSWAARIEVDRDHIRLVPRPPLRWIGEPTVEIALSAHCQRVVLCRGGVDGSRYGLRILICGENRNHQEFKVNSASLTVRQAKTLANGIANATGISVDLIQRRQSDRGEMSDVPWAPDSAVSHLRGIATVAFAATPLLGGITVGLMRASGPTAALAGILLWLAQTAAVLIYARSSGQRSRLALLHWLTKAVTFAASYSAVFLITAYSLHGR